MSDKQIEASRENGSKSRGPITPGGKQRSSQNALKQGLCSRSVLLPDESPDEYNASRVHWMRQLQPLTPTERAQAERVAIAAWRLDRYPRLEAALIGLEMNKHAGNPESAAAAFKDLADNSRALDLLNRYATRARREYESALKIYHDIVQRRRKEESSDRFDMQEDNPAFLRKWGIGVDEAFSGYHGDEFDELPNEPEYSGIFSLRTGSPPSKAA